MDHRYKSKLTKKRKIQYRTVKTHKLSKINKQKLNNNNINISNLILDRYNLKLLVLSLFNKIIKPLNQFAKKNPNKV